LGGDELYLAPVLGGVSDRKNVSFGCAEIIGIEIQGDQVVIDSVVDRLSPQPDLFPGRTIDVLLEFLVGKHHVEDVSGGKAGLDAGYLGIGAANTGGLVLVDTILGSGGVVLGIGGIAAILGGVGDVVVASGIQVC